MTATEYKDDDWSDSMKLGAMAHYLVFNEYDEMSFQDLCTRPMWRFRRIYEYQNQLRKKYDLNFSKLHLS